MVLEGRRATLEIDPQTIKVMRMTLKSEIPFSECLGGRVSGTERHSNTPTCVADLLFLSLNPQNPPPPLNCCGSQTVPPTATAHQVLPAEWASLQISLTEMGKLHQSICMADRSLQATFNISLSMLISNRYIIEVNNVLA